MATRQRTPSDDGAGGGDRAGGGRGGDRAGGGRGGGRGSVSGSAPWEPIFTGPDDDIVQGELLVTLTAPASRSMTESVPVHPLGPLAAGPDRLGVEEVDAVLADLGVRSVVRLAVPETGIAGTAVRRATGLLEPGDQPLARSFRVRLDDGGDLVAAAERLSGLDAVEVAEPNRWRETLAVPDDPRFAQQWGLPKINAPAAWDRSTGSPSVVVGVVDSGCDLNHPDLAGLLVPGQDMVDLGTSPTPPPGFRFEGDFSGRDPVPDDEVGHGTHVAGTIAALSDNAAGVAGVTWNCRVMPVKALTRMVRISDGQVRGVGSSADVAAAVRWAADHGVSVINMSLGSPNPTTVEQSAVAYAIGKGVVVVAAMGNDGTANPSYPAAYSDVVSVGAIDSADKRATFSQTGSHIDVAAPGVGIWSTYPDDSYASLSGTSMASPHVAGVAALVRSVRPAATVAEVSDILRTTARALRDVATDPVPNDRYGHGCVDARAAVDKASPVIGPVLRTPVVPCITVRFPDCGVLNTVIGPRCGPIRTINRSCWPTSPFCTITPTLTPTRWQTLPGGGGAGGAAAGGSTYDPYGLTGAAGSAGAGGYGYGAGAQAYGAAAGAGDQGYGAAGYGAGDQGYGAAGYGAAGYGAYGAGAQAYGAAGGAAGGGGAEGGATGEAAGGEYQAGYAAGYAAAQAQAGGAGAGTGPGAGDLPGTQWPRTPLIDCPPPITVNPRDCWPPRSPLTWCPPPTLPPECPPPTLPPRCPPRTLDWRCPPTLLPWQCPPTMPWRCPPRTIVDPECIPIPTPTLRPPTWPQEPGLPQPGPGGLAEAQGPGDVVGPVWPIRLRTPVIPCWPRTMLIRDCWWPQHTVLDPECIPVTIPPTLPPTTTPQLGQPGPQPGPGGFAETQGPGDIVGPVWPIRLRTPVIACWPRTMLVRDCWWPRSPLGPWCPPRTVLEPECIPVTIPPTLPPQTTPQLGQPGGGFGYEGYDPYGQSPFGA